MSSQITPHESYPQLALSIGVEDLYFKREDLHPLGSHKGRSIPHMIDYGLEKGMRSFAISSSGNAALAAALYVKELNKNLEGKGENKKESKDHIVLDVLVGMKINPKKRAKLDALKDKNIRVSAHERPLQMLFSKTQERPGHPGEATSHPLRQSNDDTALVGYTSLAEELLTIPNLRAVFVGTSSGTTAQALAAYFLNYASSQKGRGKAPVEVHIVQTSSCHPLAEEFNEDSVSTGGEGEISIADAIVDHTALRKNKLIPIIERTDGSGWIVTNESISTAKELTKKHAGLVISPNSALSVAGLMNAVYTGRAWNGAVACLICGE